MSEFDIRIGTVLDTSEAEAKLQAFINKYSNEDTLKLRLEISNEGKLEGLEKSLMKIAKLAKSIENIKLNVNMSDLSKTENGIGDTIKRNAEELEQATQSVRKELSNTMDNSLDNFGKEVDSIKKRIGTMLDDLQQLKLEPNANIQEINRLQSVLKDLGNNSNFDTGGVLGLKLVSEELDEIEKSFSQLDKVAKNTRLNKTFEDIKITPLLNQLNAVKEVMEFKKMDTSGINDLIDKLQSATAQAQDLKQLKGIFNDVKSDFGNLKKALDLKGIDSSELAIKKLLEYKEELKEEVRLKINPSEAMSTYDEIKRIEETIERLRKLSNENIVKNMFDISQLNEIKNFENITEKLQNNAKKVSDTFDKLKANADKLRSMEFVDISAMVNLESMIKDIDKSIKSLDFNNLNMTEINNIVNKMETLEDTIKHTERIAKNTKLDFEFNTDLQKIITQLNGLQSALVKLGKESSIDIGKLREELESIENLAKVDMSKAGTELSNFASRLNNLKKELNLGNISGDLSQFTKYVEDIQKAMKQLATTKDVNFAKELENDIKRTLSALKQLESGFDDVQKEFAEGFKNESFKNLGKDFQQELNKMSVEAEKLQTALYRVGRDANFSGDIGEKLSNDLKEATNEVERLQNALRNIDVGSGKSAAQDIQRLKQELEQAKQTVAELGKTRIDLDCEQALSRLQKLKNEIREFDGTLNGLDGETSIRRIFEDFENGTTSLDKAVSSLKKLENAMDKIESNSRNIGDSLRSFDALEGVGRRLEGTFQSIGDAFRRFTIGELLEEGIEEAIYGIKETIVGLDAAMTEFKRVAPESITFDDAGYKQIANDAREVAIGVGQATEDVITGMSVALQAGATTMQQATEIARTSAILQNVSDMSAESASQAIASMVNQYYSMGTALDEVQDKVKGAPRDYNNLTNAIDMMNYAGNNFAISTEGVANALQNGGAVLSNYGVTLSDSIAMISGANESLQDPSRIGNGLRSLAINFAGIKTSAKDGSIELNKSAMALQEIAGIDIFTDKSKTSVKDMMTLMDEIHEKWDSLTDVQQKGLSEGLAGKTQSAVFQSLMSGWDRVNQFRKEYSEGLMVGSAEKENLAYLDSIQGKWNQLKETMKGLVTNNVSQSFIKGMLEGATELVHVIDTITTKLGAVGSVGVAAGFTSIIKSMSDLSKIPTSFGTFFKSGGIGAIADLFALTKQGFMLDGGFMGGLKSFVTGLKTMATGATATKIAIVGLKAVLTSIGVGIAVAGIVALVKHINNVKHATENAVKAAKEGQESARQNISTLTQQKTSLAAISREYDELSQKTNKTAEEYDRLSELKQEIAQIRPELLGGYDENGDPILKLNGSLTQYLGTLDQAIAKQQELFREAQAQEADAYGEANEGKTGEDYDNDLRLANTKIGNKDYWNWDADKIANEAGDTAQKVAETLKNYREEMTKDEDAQLKEISQARSEFYDRDIAMQSKQVNEFMKSSNKLTDQQKQWFSSFMENQGWGSLTRDEANAAGYGYQKLAEKTVFTRNEMAKLAPRLDEVRKAFQDDGRINKYGKELQKIANETDRFDLQTWNEYMEEVNQRYAEGALNGEQYAYSMGIVADTMAELTNLPKETFLETLLQTGDVEAAFRAAQTGLNNFLQAYGKTTTDLRNGDNIAKILQEQFLALDSFEGQLLRDIDTTGKVNVDWLIEERKSGSLPEQLNKTIDLLTKGDGQLETEVEQKLLIGVTAEIKEHGKLKDDTIKQLEDLLSDDFVIDKEMEIAGMKFSIEEAKALRDELQEAGITAEQIKLGDTGVDALVQGIAEVQNALNQIEDKDVRIAIESQSNLLDTVDEINMMNEAAGKVKKEVRTDFIAETAPFFDGASSIEQAIASLPDNLKLKYNIGIEGDQRLTELKAKVDALPEEMRTYVYAGTYGEADVDRLKQLVDIFGETNATALLGVEGVQEAIQNATSLEECLMLMDGLVANSELSIEVRDAMLEALRAKLKELEGNKTETEVEVKEKGVEATKTSLNEVKSVANEVDGKQIVMVMNEQGVEEAYEVVDGVFRKIDENNPKEMNIEIKENGGKETEYTVENLVRKGNEYDGSTYESTVNMNTTNAETNVENLIEKTEEATIPKEGLVNIETSEAQNNVNQLNQETDKATQPKQGIISLSVQGTELITVAINEKGQLEKNGQAITHIQVNGKEQLPIAINEKGQLEVAGVALTSIDISGQDQIKVALNEKGQLEVNGQAVTDIVINGEGKVEKVKETVESLDKEKTVSISFNVNDAIDNILSRLGLTKKQETIQITVTCTDNASPVLDRINGFTNKNIAITVTCNGGDAVANQVRTIANTNIANKSFSITANAGAANSVVTTLANKQISNKTFSIVCTDNASAKINGLASKQIGNKTFTVNCKDGASSVVNKISGSKISNKTFSISCTDNASSKITSIQGKKINNKTFTVTCTDNASSKLSSISSKLSGIRSKTVTVTVRYSQVGSPPSNGGKRSVSEPQVVDTETPIIVNNTANVSALADTQSNIASVRNAMASVQASYTDTINSTYTWVDNSLEYDIDLLQDFNAQLERINNSLSLVSKQAEDAFGNEKAKLLQNQISLLQQQQNMLKHEQNELKTIQANLKSSLSKQGFKVNGNGAITNYANQLLSLEKAVESAKKAQDAYTGDNKTKQKQLQNAYDKANEKLTKAKDTLSEYYDTSNKIGDLANEWEDVKQAIEEAKNEITKAKIEQDTLLKGLQTEKLENQYDTLADKVALLENRVDTTKNEQEKIKLLQQQNSLIEQQQKKLKETEQSYINQANYYKNFLSQRGFGFDADGNVDSTRLASLVNEADYEAIKEVYELYVELQRDTIPNLQQEWYDLEKDQQGVRESIEDINEELREQQKELQELNKMKAFDFLDELINKQDKLAQQIDLLEAKMEVTYDSRNKEHMFKQQIDLLEQQKNAVVEVNKELEKHKDYLQNNMKSEGFRFDSNGNISNLDSLLNSAKTQDEYDELKEKAEEYYEVQEKITDSSIEWYEYQKQIENTKNEMEELKDELKELKRDAKLTELTNETTRLANEFEKLENLQALSGQDTLEILNKQLVLIEEQKEATQQLIQFRKEQVTQLQKELNSYGFGFDENGLVTNASSVIDKLKNTLSDEEFEKINKTLEEYFEISLDEISGLENELLDFEKTYEDILDQKLDATKKIEDEITKIYEKQIEERIEKIEEERDAQIEALNKSKEAYKRWRDEVDYEESYDEQLKKIQELQAKIDIAQRDDSLSGKKHLEDLMEQLGEEQKNLEDLVQDKIDEDINTMFDDQIDKIEEDADKKIEDLENIFTETKIAELVANAIKTGVFEDIEGNVVSLDQALLDFANNSVDYLGVMGDSLKTELLDNLGIALDTMQQLNEINKQLGNNSYQKVEYSIPLNSSASSLNTELAGLQNSNNSVSLGDMTITIQGNATPETVEDIKQLLEEQRTKIIHDIMVNVK